jgi:prophage tail gpP-like protein
MTALDDVTVAVDGMRYGGWTGFTLTRSLARMTSDFSIAVSERWFGQNVPWRIKPFAPLTVALGDDTVMTGYVEQYVPELDRATHKVTVRGRSKTGDLVECKPDIASGQFKGYTLAAIARAVCAPFGIAVVDQVGAAAPALATTALTRGETAFAFLDRLARLSSVLLTDDELGRLVLTRAGNAAADDTLRQGVNIEAVAGILDVSKRFSVYIVKGQTGLGGGASNWGGFGGVGSNTPAPIAARIASQATATDSAVPRYRPHITICESGLDLAGMQRRADWQASNAAGRSLQVRVTVAGWRQSTGKLWRCNQQVTLDVPFLNLAQSLLIVSTRFQLAEHTGAVTELELMPASAFTPDPASVKTKKAKGGKGGAGPDWSGWGGT